jgi:fatty acid desaturase
LGDTCADDTNIPDSPDPLASVDALNSLVSRKTIREVSQHKSNLQGMLQVAFHFSLVAIAAASAPIVGPSVSLLATAFASSFYFHGLHETIHRTAFRSNVLNDMFASIFGFLCLRPARHYYYYHWQHHRFTGNPELDSELQPGLLDFPVDNVARYLLYLSGIPFWCDAVLTTLKHALGRCTEAYLTTEQSKEEVAKEARVYSALYACIALCVTCNDVGKTFVGPLLRLWVLPAIMGQPFLRFYLLAEHRGRSESPLIYKNTRTMAGTNALYRRLAWQMPFHIEHHAWPTVPFHKLHTVHGLLMEAVGDIGGSGEDNILDSGETSSPLRGSGKGGYIGFNRRFVGLLHAGR